MSKSNSALGEIKEHIKARNFAVFFKGKTDNTLIQFFRYIFVGGLAAVFDWAISSLIFFFVFGAKTGAIFGVIPFFTWSVVSNGAGFIGGLILNFILSTCFVFQNSAVKNRFLEFLSFAGIGLVGLFITFGITWVCELLLADTTSLFQIIGKIVSTAVSFLWNFFARKIILYRQK